MLVCALAIAVSQEIPQSDPLVIRFDKPATHFTESCPVGNGRLGAMMFGGEGHERIVLNENTMWSGWEQDRRSNDGGAGSDRLRDAGS